MRIITSTSRSAQARLSDLSMLKSTKILPSWKTDTNFMQYVEVEKQQEMPRKVGHRLYQRQH